MARRQSDTPPQCRLDPWPDARYVSQGRTVLCTGLDGFIADSGGQGLLVHETRLLSRYRYLIEGKPPIPVGSSNVEQHSWLGYYIAPPPGDRQADPSQQTIELRVSRYVGGGLHEDLDLTNFTGKPADLDLEVDVEADFADVSEIRPRARGRRGRIWYRTDRGDWELVFSYCATNRYHHQGEAGTATIDRALKIRVSDPGSPPELRRGRIRFHIHLEPRQTWHTCLNFIPVINGREFLPCYSCGSFVGTHNQMDLDRMRYLDEATRFEGPHPGSLADTVVAAVEQAKRDLVAMRLHDFDHGSDAWTMAAGLPIYTALFGRDTLTASWQAALTGPEMMRGTLEELVRWQGKELNDWRDEQPGRMLHEAHTSPLAQLNYNPRARYYGTMTTSSFYPVALAELWHWTGDKERVRGLLKPTLDALRWLDEQGDLDGDGFYEYKTRSEQGLRNQAWKDSEDAIVYPDGTLVDPPVATCEEQAFAYAAKFLLSEVLWWLGDKDLARHFFHQAQDLKKRFHEAFWMEDEGFYAMGLDAQKRQIRSIGSNAGHCLPTGIADFGSVRRVADRLLRDDLFGGWGVRTLSSLHPSYNPHSYHRGTVWPVEQASFCVGFWRFGLHDFLERLAKSQFAASKLFDFNRLPELFGGHPRGLDHPFPATYRRANSPQAWSASSLICTLQAILGLYPYAPLGVLILDPRLPAWLPEISLRHLRVGGAAVSLRFFRLPDGRSDYEVLSLDGRLRILRQPSPWSVSATWPERLADVFDSFPPVRM